MVNRVLTLEQAARHIHLAVRELFHLAQQGDIPCRKHNGEYFFEHNAIDDWAQRNLFELTEKARVRRHCAELAENRNIEGDTIVASCLKPEWIQAQLPSRTKPGAIRDMVALAFSTGMLYDDAAFLQEVSEREEISSTAMENGAAFLHARYPDPYRAAGSFFVLGKAIHPVFFGAPDGKPTDIFFLLCCADDVLHLRLLSRLCVLCHESDVLERIRETSNTYDIYDLLKDAETEFLAHVRQHTGD